jgi:inhibitor of cysteine peptidase
MSVKPKHPIYVLLLIALWTVLAACSLIEQPGQETPAPDTTSVAEEPDGEVTGEANIESLEVLVLESFPVQVNVIASGELPDGCTTLNEPNPRLEGNTFVINLTTSRLPDEVCSQATVPFDKVVSLPVEGLSAGTYTVSVNGMTDTFTLDVDNVAQEQPTEEAGETPEGEETPSGETPDGGGAGGTGISGVVWHDLCAIAGGEGGAEAVPSDGCVETETDGFVANGELEQDEPGIEGIVVNLGEGSCPSIGLETATTGADGTFSFGDLAAGSYCVSVDALADENSSILVPGDWTSPEPQGNSAMAAHTVNVSDGAVTEDINFGWDYQFLPEAEGQPTAEKDCTDQATFQADVTVQDNEVLPPTFVFTKTWQLENSGTCTWGEGYDLVHAYGDLMGAPEEIPLQQEVPPTSTVQLSVPMVAPELNGTYLSEWLLRNEVGQTFGIPEPFWVQIVITNSIPEVGAYVNGLLWADTCDAPADVTDPPEGCVAAADGEGWVADGVYDTGEARIEGVTVALAEGGCPATSVLQTTTTDAAGRYAFTELDPGNYCVFIDASSSQNQGVLMPGIWTWPEGAEESAGISVTLEEFDTVSDAYFGWDFQFE